MHTHTHTHITSCDHLEIRLLNGLKENRMLEYAAAVDLKHGHDLVAEFAQRPWAWPTPPVKWIEWGCQPPDQVSPSAFREETVDQLNIRLVKHHHVYAYIYGEIIQVILYAMVNLHIYTCPPLK